MNIANATTNTTVNTSNSSALTDTLSLVNPELEGMSLEDFMSLEVNSSNPSEIYYESTMEDLHYPTDIDGNSPWCDEVIPTEPYRNVFQKAYLAVRHWWRTI